LGGGATGGAREAATVQSRAMTKRRYGDEEVREIFSLATTGGMRDRSLPGAAGGLTLDELQRIGEEAGIEPARVARAAEKLDARGTPAPIRRSFGLPIGMSLAAFGANLVRLPSWARERERQMEAIAEHAVKLLSDR
jgi:hypothetical protein